MDDQELVSSLLDLESDSVERKASLSEPDRIAEAICAFANDLPGNRKPGVAGINDLDIEFFERHYLPKAVAPETLAQNNRTLENQLKALRFLSPEGIPTTLGILAIGKAPRYFIPGAYIQFLRIEGNQLVDPIRNQKEINGPIMRLLGRLDDLLDAHNNVSASITEGPIEIRKWDYPMAALQQLCRNAVLHRAYEGTNAPVRVYWFDDRIEIYSSGGVFGDVTRENFGQPGVADYRNPHLAEAMKVLGYVQRFGVGIQIARQELEKNGNPPPEFKVEPTHVFVTVRKRKE